MNKSTEPTKKKRVPRSSAAGSSSSIPSSSKNRGNGVASSALKRKRSNNHRRKKSPSLWRRIPLWAIITGIVAAVTIYVFVLIRFFVDPFSFRWNAIYGEGVNPDGFEVRGIDVSRYQEHIDWTRLRNANINGLPIRFAFIKATEGTDLIDPYFNENFYQARQNDILRGAYHFFSFDSGAESQAANFTGQVMPYERMLPPAVDIEYYGKYSNSSHPDVSTVKAELGRLLELLYNHYGIRPVIYATQATYKTYIRGNFDDYDIWIRDKYFTPGDNIVNWHFWQYSDKGVLKGYSGVEKYIDLDVFRGTAEEFEQYGFPEK